MPRSDPSEPRATIWLRAASGALRWFSKYGATLIAALTAVLLSAPGFGFPYLFDDYNFLSNARQIRPGSLLPDCASVFYRPISRQVFFGVLSLFSPASALGGHLVNALLLAAVVFLGATLTSRLVGNRAGAIAAILIAVFGHWPVLVAWVSGAQDLLAIVFVLAALHLEFSGKSALALIAFCCSLLSKETAVAVAPALLWAHWLRSRSLRSAYSAALRIAAVVTTWALIDPAVRELAVRGGTSPPGTYIGVDHPKPWIALGKYVVILFNLPAPGYKVSWPGEVSWAIAVAAVPLLIALWLLRRSWSERDHSPEATLPARTREIVGFGLLLGVCPVILTSLMVHNWAPYYACFSVVGFSIVIAGWLAKQPFGRVAAGLVLSLLLGAWSRGIVFESGIPSERDLRPVARALGHLEKSFKRVAPTLPQSCVVYVSIMATNKQSVYTHMHTSQVLRVWYADPTIQVLRPEMYVSSGSPEALFCIEPSLNVFQIDPRSLAVRSSDGPVEQSRYRSVLTSYAIGLASVGQTQRSVDLLLRLSPSGSWEHVSDARVAAMLLLSRGEIRAAADLVRDLPNLPTKVALETVAILLTVPERGSSMEESAILAFGFSPRDPKVIRPLLRGLLGLGYFAVSERLATRLLTLVPGDGEALRALEQIRVARKNYGSRIVPPIQTIQFPRLSDRQWVPGSPSF